MQQERKDARGQQAIVITIAAPAISAICSVPRRCSTLRHASSCMQYEPVRYVFLNHRRCRNALTIMKLSEPAEHMKSFNLLTTRNKYQETYVTHVSAA